MVSKYSCSLLLDCMEPILIFCVCIVVSDFKPSQDMSAEHEKVIGQIHKRDQSRGKMHMLCEIDWILWSVSSLVHMLGTQARLFHTFCSIKIFRRF